MGPPCLTSLKFGSPLKNKQEPKISKTLGELASKCVCLSCVALLTKSSTRVFSATMGLILKIHRVGILHQKAPNN